MARVSAFIAAVLMVVAALAWRGYIDLPGGGGSGRDGDDGSAADVLVCASELGDLCESAGAEVIEPALDTADRLIGIQRPGEAGLGAWLVPGPLPQMVDDVRVLEGRARIFEKAETLARSPLVVLVRDDAARSLGDCVEWACIGDAALSGPLRLSAPPATDPIGLLVRGAAQTGHTGTTDFGIDTAIDDDWLTRLDEKLQTSVAAGASTAHRFLTIQGSADAFTTSTAEAEAIGVPRTVRVITPTPVAVVSLTIGLRPGVDRPDIDHGWPDEPASLPKDDGLPSPDVLYALRELF